MVDGRYYARGDRTKRRLTDAEVVALHASREPIERRVEQALDDWSSRPVVPEGRTRERGHLNLVGLPLSRIPAGSFIDVSRATNNTAAFELTSFAGQAVPAALMDFSPSIRGASNWVKRRDGSAYTSLEAGVPQLRAEDSENYLVDLELRDDGSFGVLMGRLTDELQRIGAVPILFDFAAAGYAWRAVRMAAWIAAHTGYRGAWGFGLQADGIAGHFSYRLFEHRGFSDSLHPYSADVFTATTSAGLAEIQDAPREVVERLIAGFLHALGSYEVFRAELDSLG